MSEPTRRPVLFSGIQPSGSIHLGNYMSAMRSFLRLESDYDCLFSIVDLHALTVRQEPATLRRNSLELAALYIAAGLNPERSIIYCQSHVPQHAELAWILNCFTYMGELSRMTQFKDKARQHKDNINAGLFTYPVLMAADILIVQANVVPVGKDQKQHVEVTRDLAIKFNLAFGDTFTVPEPQISEAVAVVPGLDGQKMSKSYGNTIEIFGDPKATRKRIMAIVTDSKPLEAPKDPETCNVFKLFKLFATPEQQADLAARYRAGGMGYGTAKKELADLLEAHFAPLRARRDELAADPAHVEGVLQAGAAKARALARETLKRARKAVGLE
jgi:tryptophanyl-tRNA synthetase